MFSWAGRATFFGGILTVDPWTTLTWEIAVDESKRTFSSEIFGNFGRQWCGEECPVEIGGVKLQKAAVWPMATAFCPQALSTLACCPTLSSKFLWSF